MNCGYCPKNRNVCMKTAFSSFPQIHSCKWQVGLHVFSVQVFLFRFTFTMLKQMVIHLYEIGQVNFLFQPYRFLHHSAFLCLAHSWSDLDRWCHHQKRCTKNRLHFYASAHIYLICGGFLTMCSMFKSPYLNLNSF